MPRSSDSSSRARGSGGSRPSSAGAKRPGPSSGPGPRPASGSKGPSGATGPKGGVGRSRGASGASGAGSGRSRGAEGRAAGGGRSSSSARSGPTRGGDDDRRGGERRGGPGGRASGPSPRAGSPARSGGPARGGPGPDRSGASAGRSGRPSSGARDEHSGRRGPGAPKGTGKSGPRGGRGGREDRLFESEVPVKGWGALARRGAARIEPREGVGDTASAEWRRAVQEARDQGLERDYEPESTWVRVDDEDGVRREASGAVRRGRERDGGTPTAPVAETREELSKSVGARQAEKLAKVVRDAAKAFDRERYQDSRKLLVPVTERASSFAPARELLGLTYYRLGRWKQAVKELEAFREITHSTEQHPVLADCYRALGKWAQVDELWVELREASPSAELVTEGRIVAAGALADQGKLRSAIALLGDKGWKLPKAPKEHHLRRAYALADLYERAGDVPRARDLFGRIERVDPEFGDVADRLRSL